MTSADEPRRPRRPTRLTPAMTELFASEELDPALIVPLADESAQALLRVGRARTDPEVTRRLVELVDDVGLATLADIWAQRPARSLPGLMWRLYLLREWVRADPVGAAADYAAGLAYADVAAVVAGVAHPPGPEALAEVVDAMLRGVFTGDVGVAFARAGAFCAVVAAGRGAREEVTMGGESAPGPVTGSAGRVAGSAGGSPGAAHRSAAGSAAEAAWSPLVDGDWPASLRAATAMQTLAADLEAGARAWRRGALS